ncbi:MAG: flagellar motor switch phosphatase FliY [Lachnospiraceae bacterium]|nr:flagellar motor switch phosphatase FliY [Clostridiales bacterium]MBR5368753.1 flagellar motor switch phosphatase FliY [Lachnospiraceae bacterium]
MDGMLSQDEINALLSGGIPPADDAPADASEPVPDAPPADAAAMGDQEDLTEEEKDAVGEVANISMGTSATTLFSLVNRKVNITTPVVDMATWDTIVNEYERPCVFIKIKYTVGLEGTNILILKEHDVKIITDLMMGGDGTDIEDTELTDIHLSAISEAMNQMMGSSATSLSSMLGRMIDISPPEADLVDVAGLEKQEDISSFLLGRFVRITFRMQIGDLVDSKIMQLYPIDFAKNLYDYFMDSQEPEAPPAPEPAPTMAPPSMGAPSMPPPTMSAPTMPPPTMAAPSMGAPAMDFSMGMGMQPQMGAQPMGMGMPNINIQPASFTPFSTDVNALQTQENISLIKDVPLEVTVELGRTSKAISDILDFAPGTIIELDKIAGEPVDVLVNGKLVAKGEVVVIEENFGVRVTEIIN